MKARCLLSVDDWDRMTERAVAERSGRPIVAIDLGGGRAWSRGDGHMAIGQDRGS